MVTPALGESDPAADLMRDPSKDPAVPTLNRSTANLIAGLLALALTAGLVIRTSGAVFTAQTDNSGNSLEAGTIVLTDNDEGSAALTMTNIAPGEHSEECIRVSYDGSLDPEQVRVFSTSDFRTAGATAMEDWVLIRIEQGTGGTFGDCTGFTGTTIVPDTPLGTWHATTNAYTNGAGTWDPAGPGEVRTYRIRLTLDHDTGNEFQGAELTGIHLSWATRSTSDPQQVP